MYRCIRDATWVNQAGLLASPNCRSSHPLLEDSDLEWQLPAFAGSWITVAGPLRILTGIPWRLMCKIKKYSSAGLKATGFYISIVPDFMLIASLFMLKISLIICVDKIYPKSYKAVIRLPDLKISMDIDNACDQWY
jgi:hypothetical protein